MDIQIWKDGYINATQLCQAGGKLLADYTWLKTTDKYLDALSLRMGIPISKLLTYEDNGWEDRVTWAHWKVAIDLA